MIHINETNGLPTNMGIVEADIEEMIFVMYMPVKLKGEPFNIANLPPQLLPLANILTAVLNDVSVIDRYVYVTCKRTVVSQFEKSTTK